MQKDKQIALKTLAIKARVYNQIRTDLFNKIIEETSWTKYKKITPLSEKEKLELFDKWFNLNKKAHDELNSYKEKRKEKKSIQIEREKRGFKSKKRTSKAEYEILMKDIEGLEKKNLVDSNT